MLGTLASRTFAVGWATLIGIGLAYAAAAEPVSYVLQTPGVV